MISAKITTCPKCRSQYIVYSMDNKHTYCKEYCYNCGYIITPKTKIIKQNQQKV